MHPPNTCFCLYQEISHPKNGNNKGICIISEGGDKNELEIIKGSYKFKGGL